MALGIFATGSAFQRGNMEKALREMRRVLVSELGVDSRMFFKDSISGVNSGYAPTVDHGRVQWGIAQEGVAVFHTAPANNQYVAVGICHSGAHEPPTEKTATSAKFDSAVAWIAMDRWPSSAKRDIDRCVGRVLENGMSKFEALCSMLPEDVNWGDAITPQMVEHIVLAERDACAKTCETLPRKFRTEFHSVSAECAEAIRARSNAALTRRP